MLRRPLQAWLPLLGETQSYPQFWSDLRRAYDAYRGEGRVWLLPGISEERRWWRDPFWELAIPAARLNRVDVYHVGTNRFVWGPESATRFPSNSSVEGLLGPWLRVDVERELRPVESSNGRIEVPDFPGKSVRYVPVTVRAASARVVGDTSSSGSVKGRNQWPPGLAQLFPTDGGGAEELAAQSHMTALAKAPAKDFHAALVDAKNSAFPYVSEAYAFQRDGWFAPTFVENGQEPTWLKLQAHPSMRVAKDLIASLRDKQLARALNSNAWRRKLLEPMLVLRVWSVVGLFWALLLDRLEGYEGFAVCSRCGRPIGTGSRFCGPEDNRECFNRRRAEDQKRSRMRARERR